MSHIYLGLISTSCSMSVDPFMCANLASWDKLASNKEAILGCVMTDGAVSPTGFNQLSDVKLKDEHIDAGNWVITTCDLNEFFAGVELYPSFADMVLIAKVVETDPKVETA